MTLFRFSLLLALSSSATPPAAPHPGPGELVAIRVGRAETVSQGTIENAVILVEDGKIVTIGEDLPIERGIPVLERSDWVATPGLVNCHTRLGLDGGSSAGGFEPQRRTAWELYPWAEAWEEVRELGVTTLGLVPSGDGIPGQAVAVRPRGESAEEMIVADPAYLKIQLETSSSSKKRLRDAFEDVEKYDEKLEKAREKWEKEQERKKKKEKKEKEKSKEDDDEEDEEKDGDKAADENEREKEDEEDEESDVFSPPEPDEKVQPFLDLREGRLAAMMSIRKASDYLHLLDVLGDRELDWFLHVPLRDDIDLYEVKEPIGERGLLIVMTPEITLQPATRRERNLPAELQRAGAKVALLPEDDTLEGHRHWLHDVGHLVAAGLDRQAALAALTLEAARALGLEERLGSLEEGKDANILLWNGDPFEPRTRLQAVMLEGEIVYGEENVR